MRSSHSATSAERAEKAAKEYGTADAKVYEDYRELVKDPEIDVVHVCTPNVAHCPITVAAFEAGKHVLCEKPMAATTLCGTKAGAEIIGGMSREGDYDLIFNKTNHGVLTEESLSAGGTIAFFEGGSDKEEVIECKQWLEALLNDTEPLVKPEQAFMVTKILDNIYKAAREGHEIKF